MKSLIDCMRESREREREREVYLTTGTDFVRYVTNYFGLNNDERTRIQHTYLHRRIHRDLHTDRHQDTMETKSYKVT